MAVPFTLLVLPPVCTYTNNTGQTMLISIAFNKIAKRKMLVVESNTQV
jgi:hypothetical protein